MATSALNLTFGYTDETKRDLKITPLAAMDSTAIAGVKANIMSFNENDVNSVKDILLSDEGASCTGIVGAYILTTDEQEINLNDVE